MRRSFDNPPHLLSPEEISKKWDTDLSNGLDQIEAGRRLSEYGANDLIELRRRGPFAILFDQVKDIMVLILVAAAGISFLLHEMIDAVVILVIVLLNTALGFWQEFKAENALVALKKLAVPRVRVRRNGLEHELNARELVPGDLVILEAGSMIPADARLVEAVNLKIQESALTGESEPVVKAVEALDNPDIPLADRVNMAFMGTVVTYGRGRAVVTQSGMKTELGRIANMLQNVQEEQTPLQRRLARLGRVLAGFALLLIAVVSLITYARGAELKEIFMTSISMAVAAIPEGLLAVVTITLALGGQRMLKKKSLIRNLPAVETLGSVTAICSDKTGTLTQNVMTVTHVLLPDRQIEMKQVDEGDVAEAVRLFLTANILCNDARVQHTGSGQKESLGDPTEVALVLAGEKVGLEKTELEKLLPRIAELPFDSNRKRMSTVHRRTSEWKDSAPGIGDDPLMVFCKGSVDGLLDQCSYVLLENRVVPLDKTLRSQVMAENSRMAERSYRILGSAFRTLSENEAGRVELYEKELIFLGMSAMIDPVRPQAIEAVRQCRRAGIRVIMITGDHPVTALAVARQLGLAQQENETLSGSDLAAMDVSELKKRIKQVSVFARVSPEHKMNLIDILQEQNQIVAMTGDGVNDAPALKSADIGVAMGITGTDVSKESSDMVLLDDNFATIVAAVREGRTIFDNIRKFVKYILTGNTGEIMAMLLGPAFGTPIPLLPIQILWINLVTDGVPAIALGYEPAEQNVMERPPFDPKEGVFSRGIGKSILLYGMVIGVISILVGYIFWRLDPVSRAWQTMIFTTLTFCQLTLALCVRRNYQSLFKTPLTQNCVIFIAVLVTVALQMLLVYHPWFNLVFRTQPLAALQLLVCAGAATIVIGLTELEKLMNRSKSIEPKTAVN